MSRLWLLLLAACGSERVVVMSQVIHVDAEQTACTDTCYTELALYEMCGPDAGYIDDKATPIYAISNDDPKKLTGVIEFEYTGNVAKSGKPYLAYLLGTDDGAGAATYADAHAAGDAALLYRVDLQQGITNIDPTRLVAASGDTLSFAYEGFTETHTIDKPRPIVVNVESDEIGCCSTAHPTTGALWLAAITQILARRRCRRARPPRR